MKVELWNSYSCNNSSDFRLVARFEDASAAARMGKELAEFFKAYAVEFDRITEDNDYTIPEATIPTAAAFADKHEFEWDPNEILAWGDEGLHWDPPSVGVVDKTLAIYHDYCGGFTGNIVRALEAHGAEVEEEERCPPDLSARFTLPKAAAGDEMAGALAAFFNQASVEEYLHDFADPPWGEPEQRLQGEADAVVWYREGDHFAFKMPFPIGGLEQVKTYLGERGATDIELKLCDAADLASFDMRDVIRDLELLMASGEKPASLDLTERKLRFIPPVVLEMTWLEELILDDNLLETLPAEIAKLVNLKALSVDGNPMSSLPAALASLGKLRRLDITGTHFEELPAVLQQLPALRELRASRLPRGASIAVLADLGELEWLCLSFFRPKEGLTEFPEEVLALKKLTYLDVSTSALSSIPDAISELEHLEHLDLSGVLGHLTTLPPLHQLSNLAALKMGGGASNTGKYAPHSVLDGAWKIASLERLSIDRYGKERDERPALTALPDDAFSAMPNLRYLDCSWDELESLPESFYQLENLEEVVLSQTNLDRATLDRLRQAFPEGVKFHLDGVKTRFDVDDPHWRAVNTKVKDAAKKMQQQERADAVAGFEEALALCGDGTVHSEYDKLYALYGIVECLSHQRLQAEGDEKESMSAGIVERANQALDLVPPVEQIWFFTQESNWQREVTRRCGNALAWILMERGELERALSVAERALSVGGANGYVQDTKVRILLAMGRDNQAYAIVDTILTEDPSFDDFKGIAASAEYEAWKRAGRPAT